MSRMNRAAGCMGFERACATSTTTTTNQPTNQPPSDGHWDVWTAPRARRGTIPVLMGGKGHLPCATVVLAASVISHRGTAMQAEAGSGTGPTGGGACPLPHEREPHLLCQGLLGVHLGPPPALPKEIELLLWYHQLKELGVLDPEEYQWKKRQLLATPSNLTASPAPADEPAQETGP